MKILMYNKKQVNCLWPRCVNVNSVLLVEKLLIARKNPSLLKKKPNEISFVIIMI